MTTHARSSARFLTPGDVALAAPLMLGYWPEGSACAVFVDREGHAVLIMRWDDDVDPSGLPWAAVGPTAPEAVHLVIYPAGPHDRAVTDDPLRWPRAADALKPAGARLGHVLVVTQQGRDVAWTGARGEGRAETIPSREVASRATRWGYPLWRSCRADYVSDIDPDPVKREAVEQSLARQDSVTVSSREAVVGNARAWLRDGTLDPHGIAAFVVALADVRVRDTLLWELMHDEPGTWPSVADRLASVVAASPDSHAAAPATVLAILRWQCGDGSRAAAAAERARAAHPGYTLAALVEQCLATGMHPLTWRRGLAGLTREDCLRAA